MTTYRSNQFRFAVAVLLACAGIAVVTARCPTSTESTTTESTATTETTTTESTTTESTTTESTTTTETTTTETTTTESTTTELTTTESAITGSTDASRSGSSTELATTESAELTFPEGTTCWPYTETKGDAEISDAEITTIFTMIEDPILSTESSPMKNTANHTTAVESKETNGTEESIKTTSDFQLKDYCASNPCSSNENCVNRIDGPDCECIAGYTGSLCDVNINECSPNPCRHGFCSDRINGFKCTCDDGYFGTRCQRDVDDCPPKEDLPCGAGTCVDKHDSFTCLCDDGESRDYCVEPTTPSVDELGALSGSKTMKSLVRVHAIIAIMVLTSYYLL